LFTELEVPAELRRIIVQEAIDQAYPDDFQPEDHVIARVPSLHDYFSLRWETGLARVSQSWRANFDAMRSLYTVPYSTLFISTQPTILRRFRNNNLFQSDHQCVRRIAFYMLKFLSTGQQTIWVPFPLILPTPNQVIPPIPPYLGDDWEAWFSGWRPGAQPVDVGSLDIEPTAEVIADVLTDARNQDGLVPGPAPYPVPNLNHHSHLRIVVEDYWPLHSGGVAPPGTAVPAIGHGFRSIGHKYVWCLREIIRALGFTRIPHVAPNNTLRYLKICLKIKDQANANMVIRGRGPAGLDFSHLDNVNRGFRQYVMSREIVSEADGEYAGLQRVDFDLMGSFREPPNANGTPGTLSDFRRSYTFTPTPNVPRTNPWIRTLRP
jgi:hypothetical protein